MAGLWWITVTMVFCLSAGRLAEIDQTQLTTLIENIQNEYNRNVMYAVAVSIPRDENQVSYDLTKVTPNQQTQWNDGILRTARLVVAQIKHITPKKGSPYTDHAEWRVLHKLHLEGQDGDLLVFFSLANPCYKKCATGKKKITGKLRSLFNEHVWGAKAFVFNVLFQSHGGDIDSENRSSALTNIGAAIGRKNIFRCYKPNHGDFHCIRCFNGNQIDPNCIS